MNILLDGETVQADGTNQGLDALREQVRKRRLVPTRLKVRGSEVGLERLAALAPSEDEVELDTVPLGQAVERAYADAERCLPGLEASAEGCCERLMLGRVKEGMESFAGLCRGLDAFFGLMLPLDFLAGVPEARGWGGTVERFKPLLMATQEAVAQQDWVLVEDQLRYEWSPNLRLCRERLPEARGEVVRLAGGQGGRP